MKDLIVNPNIDLSILEEMGFEKRYNEYTGNLDRYVDSENKIIIYLSNTISLERAIYTYEQENQIIQMLELYKNNIIMFKEDLKEEQPEEIPNESNEPIEPNKPENNQEIEKGDEQ